MNKYYILFLLIILYSCKNENNIKIKNPTVYFEQLITKEKKAIFKNLNFDFTLDEVKKIENAQLYDATNEHLFYSYNFPKDSTNFVEYADIKYFFDEESILKIITANIYLNDSIQETQLLENFKEYYTIKYGDTKLDDYEYDNWDATADSKNTKGKYYYNIGIKKLKDEYGVAIEILKL
jgi:hypothetical protein